MLSSPKTHVRNITSNIYSATLGQLRDGLASGVEDHLVKSGKLDKALEKQGLKREDYMKSTGKMSGAAWKDSHVGLATGTELNSLQSKLHKAQMELDTLSTGDKNYAKKAETLKKRISDLEAQIKPKQEAYD
jgi:chromosome segregation ATPase